MEKCVRGGGSALACDWYRHVLRQSAIDFGLNNLQGDLDEIARLRQRLCASERFVGRADVLGMVGGS